MNNKTVITLLLMVLANAPAFSQAVEKKFIPPGDKHISYMGRVGITDSCAEFYWTGSNAAITVQGAGTVKALLADNLDNNYFYIVVDGAADKAIKINIGKAKQWYKLASFTDKEKHQVQLFKITNTDDHTVRLYGFEIDPSVKVLRAHKKPKRKIEFFGNSITCGHGVDVPVDSADSGKPEFFNNYRAYGAITARHFNAQYHCTAKSGIGITVSWFKETMPDIYDLLNPQNPTVKWDFAQYQPDIVVVNLFQNDSWIVNQPRHEQFKTRFGTAKPSEEFIIKAYANFIQSLRGKYPKANIICGLGNMDATKEGSKWPGYIVAAVASLGDRKITTHFFAYKNTPGHPKIKEQQAMADDLIAFIEKERYWK